MTETDDSAHDLSAVVDEHAQRWRARRAEIERFLASVADSRSPRESAYIAVLYTEYRLRHVASFMRRAFGLKLTASARESVSADVPIRLPRLPSAAAPLYATAHAELTFWDSTRLDMRLARRAMASHGRDPSPAVWQAFCTALRQAPHIAGQMAALAPNGPVRDAAALSYAGAIRAITSKAVFKGRQDAMASLDLAGKINEQTGAIDVAAAVLSAQQEAWARLAPDSRTLEAVRDEVVRAVERDAPKRSGAYRAASEGLAEILEGDTPSDPTPWLARLELRDEIERAGFTEREQDVLDHVSPVGSDMKYADAARELGISEGTVKATMSHIRAKLNRSRSRAEND